MVHRHSPRKTATFEHAVRAHAKPRTSPQRHAKEGKSVSAGLYFTSYSACGVRIDGAVACWGQNDVGESTPPSGSFVSVPLPHPRPRDHRCRRWHHRSAGGTEVPARNAELIQSTASPYLSTSKNASVAFPDTLEYDAAMQAAGERNDMKPTLSGAPAHALWVMVVSAIGAAGCGGDQCRQGEARCNGNVAESCEPWNQWSDTRPSRKTSPPAGTSMRCRHR